MMVYLQGFYQSFSQSSPPYSQNPLFYCQGSFKVWGADVAFWEPYNNFPHFRKFAFPGTVSSISIRLLPTGSHWQVYINVVTVLHAACFISSGFISFQLNGARHWGLGVLLMGQSSS